MLKDIIKKLLIHLYYVLYKNPQLKRNVIAYIKNFPFIEMKLRQIVHKHRSLESSEIENIPFETREEQKTFRFPLVNEKHLLSKEAQFILSRLVNKREIL